jgi:predicted site-specific integrase-resolvase
MKLREYAKLKGVCKRTAYLWFKKGKIEGAYQLPGGMVIIPDPEPIVIREHTIVYARVSSAENKTNLDTQAQRLCDFCAAKGWIVHRVVKEIGSGLNDTRDKLLHVLKDVTIQRIVVEHKDRLARSGFGYIKELFPGEIIVINDTSNKEEDLMQDFVSIVTSYCARLYGHRRGKRKTEKIIEELKAEDA